MKAIPVFDCLEMFQPNSIVDRSGETMAGDAPPRKNVFHTDDGTVFESYIAKGSFVIHERSQKRPGTTSWLKQKVDMALPFKIVIEKSGDYEFSLKTEPMEREPNP